jgi:(2Fe-2S) ferredoxin
VTCSPIAHNSWPTCTASLLQVLAPEVVSVRDERSTATRSLQRLTSISLGNVELEMLRHAFVLMAGGDDPEIGLLSHQLTELAVMAGLDPAADATHKLVARLLQRRGADGRIKYDEFLKVRPRTAECLAGACHDDCVVLLSPDRHKVWTVCMYAASMHVVLVLWHKCWGVLPNSGSLE